MTTEEANTKRCIAHEIILDLYKAKKVSQIKLLKQACDLSLREMTVSDHPNPSWINKP